MMYTKSFNVWKTTNIYFWKFEITKDMKLLNDDSDRLGDIKCFRKNIFKNMLNFDRTY